MTTNYKKRKGRVITKFASRINCRTISVRNSLTKDLLHHLEINPDVESYNETSQKVYYTLQGKYIPFHFDFEIQLKNKEQLAVICPSHFIYPNTAVLNKIVASCHMKGYELAFYTEERIRRQPYLENIKLLYKYAGQIPSVEDHIAVYRFFTDRRAAYLEDLIIFFTNQGLRKSIIYTLLFKNILIADLERPLNEQSVIRCASANPPTEPFAREVNI
jgi:hypothetical protein